MNVVHKSYEDIVSLDNIIKAWDGFKRGKTGKLDVITFERYLEDNIFSLQQELVVQTYRHGPYYTFHIMDPKHRVISKATVKDRLVHHVVFQYLYNIFDSAFIYHSYACRSNKGTHLAVQNLSDCLRRVSQNYTGPAYALKCDVRKFFQSVNHQKLLQIIKRKIKDDKLWWLIANIISSFHAPVDKIVEGGGCLQEMNSGLGLPIGNLTSQIFANIYLNELDHYLAERLGVKHYFRYADDFIIVHSDRDYLVRLLPMINDYLKDNLFLQLHPDKVSLRKLSQGIDFLGYVILPYYIVLRTKTKKRMMKKLFIKQSLLEQGILDDYGYRQSLSSYFGMLKHCDGYKLSNVIKNNFNRN